MAKKKEVKAPKIPVEYTIRVNSVDNVGVVEKSRRFDAKRLTGLIADDECAQLTENVAEFLGPDAEFDGFTITTYTNEPEDDQ